MYFVKNFILYSLFITSSSYALSSSHKINCEQELYDYQIVPLEEIFPLENLKIIIDIDQDDIDNKDSFHDVQYLQPVETVAKIADLQNTTAIKEQIIEDAVSNEDDIVPVPHELINSVKKAAKKKKKLEEKQRKEKYKLFKKSKRKKSNKKNIKMVN